MKDLEARLQQEAARRAADAERFRQVDADLCMLCGAEGPDKRNLYLSCFYAVQEVVPEAIDLREVDDEAKRDRGYYLRICKTCRAGLLSHLEVWRNECVAKRGQTMDSDGELLESDPERNIPVRINGAIRLLTRAEWDERQEARPHPPADLKPMDCFEPGGR